MGYARQSGYEPASMAFILSAIMTEINVQFGTDFTAETFLGTNWYKFSYAVAQQIQKSETKTNEVFLKLENYIDFTNKAIIRPVVTNPGLIAALGMPTVLKPTGYVASIKKPIDADAGKVFICVNLDNADPDYAAYKLEVANIIKNSTVAGVVSQGAESTALVLSNGQSFDFKYKLPNVIEPLFRLTLTLSENNQSVILSPDDDKQILLANFAERYAMGRNLEPQKLFTYEDAPWTSNILLEYKIGVGSWTSAVYDANYDDLFVMKLSNLTVVEV